MMSANDYGLTDDGDFAILGVNVEEKAEGDDSDGNGPSSTSISGSSNSGTEIGWQGVGNMLFNEELLKSGRVDMGVGATNKYKDFRGNEIVPKTDPIVKEWLLEILPSLKDSDMIDTYAEGLSNLGFHPQCASMCELTYDDLDFMKALHQRYLFKEITGEEHPFEPWLFAMMWNNNLSE